MLDNMVEFYVGLTNLTVCLPMTLVKAWHLSRTRRFDVQKVHKKLQRIEEFEEEPLIKEENQILEIELDPKGQELVEVANCGDTKVERKNLKANKPLSRLIESFEGKISQQLVEHQKQFHKSSESLSSNTESKRKVWKIVRPSNSSRESSFGNTHPVEEKSLSVASRVKLLEPKPKLQHEGSKNEASSPSTATQEKRLSVAERVKNLDQKIVPDDLVVIKENSVNPKELEEKSDIPSKQFVRLASGRTRAEIKHLNEILKSQTNILSCSNERLDRIEINFEKVENVLFSLHVKYI